MKKILFACLMLGVVFTSCAKKTDMGYIYQDEQGMFEKALQKYESRKWSSAIDQLQRYIFSYPATKRTEEAQYYLADAYFQSKDYTQAIVELEYFIANFRNYNLSMKAAFRLSQSYYMLSPRYQFDQTLTYKAIEVMNDFIAKYPESAEYGEVDSLRRILVSRIEEKKMHTGNYYLKRKDYKAAEVYFDQVLSDNLVEEWKDFFYFKYGYTKYKLKKTAEAENAFMLVSKDGKYAGKAASFISKLRIGK